MRTVVVVACLALVVLACTPGEEPVLPIEGESGEPAAAPEEPLGAPDSVFVPTLRELTARGREAALAWQDDPRLAEVVALFDDDGAVTTAELTYLAADADRILSVTVTAGGVTPTRIRLDNFSLAPIDDFSLDAIAPLPGRALDPIDLAEAAASALSDCGVSGDPTSVVYASGAPWSWNDGNWEPRPTWSAAVRSGSVGAVVLDVDGGPADPDQGETCATDLETPEVDIDSAPAVEP